MEPQGVDICRVAGMGLNIFEEEERLLLITALTFKVLQSSDITSESNVFIPLLPSFPYHFPMMHQQVREPLNEHPDFVLEIENGCADCSFERELHAPNIMSLAILFSVGECYVVLSYTGKERRQKGRLNSRQHDYGMLGEFKIGKASYQVATSERHYLRFKVLCG